MNSNHQPEPEFDGYFSGPVRRRLERLLFAAAWLIILLVLSRFFDRLIAVIMALLGAPVVLYIIPGLITLFFGDQDDKNYALSKIKYGLFDMAIFLGAAVLLVAGFYLYEHFY